MREQLPDGHLRDLRRAADLGQRQVVLERIGQAELAGVTQPQHRHGDEGLGDGPGPVLGVRIGSPAVGAAPAAGPDQLAVAGEARGDRGQPLRRLIAGEP